MKGREGGIGVGGIAHESVSPFPSDRPSKDCQPMYNIKPTTAKATKNIQHAACDECRYVLPSAEPAPSAIGTAAVQNSTSVWPKYMADIASLKLKQASSQSQVKSTKFSVASDERA